ncbi:ubl carboxyl-terminal hydrolase 18 isoform X3 [Triplophysa rosa]|uniref:ubl carboxyl-terminal hydrolase 18 isoform X3 n=1 Tax=Triplophysa rosa TaxID=992332 RepID=UPI00254616CC|nr:ubl carboxyl-terminal hydrolase 18 isoform X3 [Triplophysa rosa]
MGLSWIKMASYYYMRCNYSLDYHRVYVRGLSNYGLTCCINALLQSFSATPELLELLNNLVFLRYHPPEEAELNNVPMQLKNALCAMKDTNHHSPHRDFLDCLHRHSIHRFTEHDADEIFHSILNLTQKQMTDKDLAEEIRKLYEIKVETQVMCKECSHIQKTPNSLYSLPLAIREGYNTLESCVQSFAQQQTLRCGEECYCDRCMMKRPFTHQLKLVSLPSVLCIHLKRFRNDGITRKLHNRVTFLETLNMNICNDGQSENAKGYYSLYAVIVHIGTALCGHYTAYIRPTQDQNWCYADDSTVRQKKDGLLASVQKDERECIWITERNSAGFSSHDITHNMVKCIEYFNNRTKVINI